MHSPFQEDGRPSNRSLKRKSFGGVNTEKSINESTNGGNNYDQSKIILDEDFPGGKRGGEGVAAEEESPRHSGSRNIQKLPTKELRTNMPKFITSLLSILRTLKSPFCL